MSPKKLILVGSIVVALFAFYFSRSDFFHNLIASNVESNLAAALKVELSAVRNWQREKGIQRNLAYGNSGSDVKLLQSALQSDEKVSVKPEITGYFGAQTEGAVKEFQKMRGLPETGIVGELTRLEINSLYLNELCPSAPDKIYQDYSNSKVDKNNALPEGYTPSDLVDITDSVKTFGITCLKRDAADSLKLMFADAEKEGIYLAVTSSFRREEIQELLNNFWLTINYADNIDKIAKPRHSEHQLGTTVDFAGKSSGYNGVDQNFSKTKEGEWLAAHAVRFGFVQSYPDGKKHVTGYDPEPWHYRYVGIDNARNMAIGGLTPTEYFK